MATAIQSRFGDRLKGRWERYVWWWGSVWLERATLL